MKKYEVLKGKKWNLKKVTPKAVRLYQNMIMESADTQEELEKSGKVSDALRASVKTLNIFLESEEMIPWAEVIFDIDDEDKKALCEAIEKEDYDSLPQKDHLIFNTVYTKNSLIDLLRFYIQNDFTLEEDKKKIAKGFFTYKKDICYAFIKVLQEKKDKD